MGFLYYFGFVFNMNMQKINIFMEGDDPHYPIQQVKFKQKFNMNCFDGNSFGLVIDDPLNEINNLGKSTSRLNR